MTHLRITASELSIVDVDRALVVDAHRNHRGPYTFGGTLVRMMASEAMRVVPDLVRRYDSELLAIAPELDRVLESTHETLTSSAAPSERTRFYPRARTERVAHAVTELVRDAAAAAGCGRPVDLVVRNANHMDPTDAELVAVMLRRLDSSLVRMVLVDGEDEIAPVSASEYVASDCTLGDSRAYDALAPGARAQLHDARARELERMGEASLGLGAIPLHRERGSDRAKAIDAMFDALERCTLLGFYDAAVDLGERIRPLLDWQTDPERCWLVTAKLTTALTVLERPDEAADLYDEACASTPMPSVHLQAAYGRAMLYTRFYDEARRDHQRAKAWINTAIAISSLFPDAERRAFNTTFNENGLALIEMHLGDSAEALRLVTDGLERLDAEIGPDEQTLHRSVLRYNRAQLLGRMGRLPEAIAEYSRAIAADPNHSEYWFERASLHRKAGDVDAALEDLDAAIAIGAPYAEPHYNRGDLWFELGKLEAAIADFDRVLELEPLFLDAWVNRASAKLALGDVEGASADADAGLALEPAQPHLLCIAGLVAQSEGRAQDARALLIAALSRHETLVDAWSALAVLAFEAGEAAEAVAHLDRAIELSDDPSLRANRAIALESLGRLDEAANDYAAALETADPDERAELEDALARCARVSA